MCTCVCVHIACICVLFVLCWFLWEGSPPGSSSALSTHAERSFASLHRVCLFIYFTRCLLSIHAIVRVVFLSVFYYYHLIPCPFVHLCLLYIFGPFASFRLLLCILSACRTAALSLRVCCVCLFVISVLRCLSCLHCLSVYCHLAEDCWVFCLPLRPLRGRDF